MASLRRTEADRSNTLLGVRQSGRSGHGPSRSVGTHGVPVARTDSMWRPGTKAVTAAVVGPTHCRSAHPHHLGVDAQFQRLHCHGSVEVALRLHHLPVGVQIRLNWGKYAEQHPHDEEENDEESIVSNGWTLRLLEVAQMRFGRLEAGIEVQSMTEMKHRLLQKEITDLEVTKVSRKQGVMQLWKITFVSRVPNRQLRNLKAIDFYVKDFMIKERSHYFIDFVKTEIALRIQSDILRTQIQKERNLKASLSNSWVSGQRKQKNLADS